MTAPGDPIGIIQSTSQKSLGDDPDTAPGVTRLDTGYYGTDRDGHKAGEIIFGQNGHGRYWDDPKSDAFHNIVDVITGGEANAYVEREIESNHVEVHLGDDNNWGRQIHDALVARRYGAEDPYGNPHVTNHPELGPKIGVG
jgi:hypothetical protein